MDDMITMYRSIDFVMIMYGSIDGLIAMSRSMNDVITSIIHNRSIYKIDCSLQQLRYYMHTEGKYLKLNTARFIYVQQSHTSTSVQMALLWWKNSTNDYIGKYIMIDVNLLVCGKQ